MAFSIADKYKQSYMEDLGLKDPNTPWFDDISGTEIAALLRVPSKKGGGVDRIQVDVDRVAPDEVIEPIVGYGAYNSEHDEYERRPVRYRNPRPKGTDSTPFYTGGVPRKHFPPGTDFNDDSLKDEAFLKHHEIPKWYMDELGEDTDPNSPHYGKSNIPAVLWLDK